ncbi:PH domain-containing protein [Planomonospora sp. ID82291]|uniref:PH domain-containing protein n=1 Tax=Planomonospora sp. ID82291 TaxID=2738136 RepID=UPI0018C3EA9B|nr:PH domain-containing protein [Planomonospora sp. ID82291]MBG0813464.1 PH domain-containing protein [Planomonospora sp. ID82291]
MSGAAREVFRSKAALILGWVWVAFAALNAVDLVVRYSGPPSLAAGAVLAVLTALVFVTCIRPAVVLTDGGVLVRNPLRDAFVPWTAVDGVAVGHAIAITSGDAVVRCWTPQTTARERAAAVRRGRSGSEGGGPATEPVRSRGEQAAAEALAGRTHADWAAEQIRRRAEAARPRTGAGATEAGAGAGATEAGAGAGATEAGAGPAVLRITWAPSALVVLGAALALVVAAFLV